MQIQTPDIGVDKATVADILVKVGDTIAVDDSIVLLESDKASVEVPSTVAGVVKSILVQQGDEVTEGAVLIELETEAQTAVATEVAAPQAEVDAAPKQDAEPVVAAAPSSATSNTAQEVDVQVPDIGVEKAVVGEILVQVGDAIDVDQSIIVVESDKATVEVPSTVSGTVTAIQINTGDTVKEGVVILKVKTAAAAVTQVETPQVASAEAAAATASAATASAPQTTASAQVEVAVPDLGVDKATVAEILVQVG
ncbi:biotin/lipoyl-containing protein, partial [Acinetobacter sp. 207]